MSEMKENEKEVIGLLNQLGDEGSATLLVIDNDDGMRIVASIPNDRDALVMIVRAVIDSITQSAGIDPVSFGSDVMDVFIRQKYGDEVVSGALKMLKMLDDMAADSKLLAEAKKRATGWH